MTAKAPKKTITEPARDIEVCKEADVVVVGGGPVTQEWADEIGADGFGENAVQAVELLKGLLES